jgi:hypothetical protein
VSCGSGIISTVGFTTVYISDDARGSLFADSQQFARLRIDNNNRSIPLVNFAWRAVKDKFVGTSRVAQVCDQNNNPILAFSGDMVGYATDVNKSTLLQVTYNKHTGYVWIYHGSYTLTDTAVLG